MKKALKLSALATGLLFAGLSANVFAAEQDNAAKMPNISNKNILVGFWHNWATKSHGY